MKLTKSQLKQIIKEEIGKLMEGQPESKFGLKHEGPFDTEAKAKKVADMKTTEDKKKRGGLHPWKVQEMDGKWWAIELEQY